ncbi:alpha/beta fold hydrolase [Chryseobacterium gleum]|uniref:alpha/beta fold hydrolase n=1 Tax=Chryseobacterium gleum TaxID=250 RepID=UPI00192C8217|nr:hypothetical protein [Chryseobacterium gleum]QQY34829.1 hypothetical protein I6I60_26000 [Chryseobacterium gleum]
MGGIIAQLLGSNYPERVLSLTIIMSTSLNPSLPKPDPEIMAMMTQPAADPNVDREGYLRAKYILQKKYRDKEICLIRIRKKLCLKKSLSVPAQKTASYGNFWRWALFNIILTY